MERFKLHPDPRFRRPTYTGTVLSVTCPQEHIPRIAFFIVAIFIDPFLSGQYPGHSALLRSLPDDVVVIDRVVGELLYFDLSKSRFLEHFACELLPPHSA